MEHDVRFKTIFQASSLDGAVDGLAKVLKSSEEDKGALEDIFIGKTKEDFYTAMKSNHAAYLIGDPSNLSELAQHITPPPKQGTTPIITAVMESRTVYGNQTAESIATALYEQGYIQEESQRTYRLIFQESLMNAVEHGNLHLSSEKDKKNDQQNWFDKYYETVNDKLYNTEEGCIPIIIHIAAENGKVLTWIEDFGQGFDTANAYEALDVENPYGKGLSLCASMSEIVNHDKDGRRFFFQIPSTTKSKGFSAPTRTTAKEQGRILIVDDQQINLNISTHFLKSAGFRNLETAQNGKEALEKVEAFQPDLILLDIIMPEMDGFETCQALKNNPKTADIPVLFMSGLTDVKSRTQGYRLGAVDYVNKPIERNEMIARAEVHILNGMMLRSTQAFSKRMVDDLEGARRFQLDLLPHMEEIEEACSKYNIQIDSEYTPCEELAGDYWTFFQVDDQNLAIAMVDFTGHGVLAALNTIRLHALFYELENYMTDPIEFTKQVNTRLEKMLQLGSFATLFYGVLNTQTGELKYVSCGAPAPVIIPENTEEEISLLPSAGIPAGLMKTDMFNPDLHTAQLNQGDLLLLYSDALVETAHKDGRLWMDEDNALLTEAIHACRTGDNATLGKSILRKFHKTAHKPLKDDLTFFSIMRRGS